MLYENWNATRVALDLNIKFKSMNELHGQNPLPTQKKPLQTTLKLQRNFSYPLVVTFQFYDLSHLQWTTEDKQTSIYGLHNTNIGFLSSNVEINTTCFYAFISWFILNSMGTLATHISGTPSLSPETNINCTGASYFVQTLGFQL